MKIILFLFMCSLFSLTSCQLNIDTRENNEQEFIYVHILHESGIEWNKPMIPVDIATLKDGSVIGYSDMNHPVDLMKDFYQVISYNESNIVPLTGEFTDIILTTIYYLKLSESDDTNEIMVIRNGKSILSKDDLEAIVIEKIKAEYFLDSDLPSDFENEQYEEYLIPKPLQPDGLNFHGI